MVDFNYNKEIQYILQYNCISYDIVNVNHYSTYFKVKRTFTTDFGTMRSAFNENYFNYKNLLHVIRYLLDIK